MALHQGCRSVWNSSLIRDAMITKKHSLQQTSVFRNHCCNQDAVMRQGITNLLLHLCFVRTGWLEKKGYGFAYQRFPCIPENSFLNGLKSQSPWCFPLCTFSVFPVSKPAFADHIFCFFTFSVCWIGSLLPLIEMVNMSRLTFKNATGNFQRGLLELQWGSLTFQGFFHSLMLPF